MRAPAWVCPLSKSWWTPWAASSPWTAKRARAAYSALTCPCCSPARGTMPLRSPQGPLYWWPRACRTGPSRSWAACAAPVWRPSAWRPGWPPSPGSPRPSMRGICPAPCFWGRSWPTCRPWTWPPTSASWRGRISPSYWCRIRTGPKLNIAPSGRGSAPLCPVPSSPASCWKPCPPSPAGRARAPRPAAAGKTTTAAAVFYWWRTMSSTRKSPWSCWV